MGCTTVDKHSRQTVVWGVYFDWVLLWLELFICGISFPWSYQNQSRPSCAPFRCNSYSPKRWVMQSRWRTFPQPPLYIYQVSQKYSIRLVSGGLYLNDMFSFEHKFSTTENDEKISTQPTICVYFCSYFSSFIMDYPLRKKKYHVTLVRSSAFKALGTLSCASCIGKIIARVFPFPPVRICLGKAGYVVVWEVDGCQLSFFLLFFCYFFVFPSMSSQARSG